MREFLKIELSAGLRAASLQKTCKLLWQFGFKKFKLLGRLVAPQKQQAAGADLFGRVRVASDAPDIGGPGSLLRLFESGGQSRRCVALIIETGLPRAVSDL